MAYYIWKSYKLKFKPWEAFSALSGRKNCFFLDSSLNSVTGRYSFLGFDPCAILKTQDEQPFEKLRKILRDYRINASSGAPPFFGGAVGYFGYDLGFLLEKKLVMKTYSKEKIPDSWFGFYNTVAGIDNLKKELFFICVGFPEKKSSLARALCRDNFRKLENIFSEINPQQNKKEKSRDSCALKSNFTKAAYIAAVKKAKEYISRGDVYQVNLSQHFQARSILSAQQIYRKLRELSPAGFSAYLDTGDFQILSSSPERFLQVCAGKVATRPMKGTRPRGSNTQKDIFYKRQLLNSIKDKAELTMIVDLERNDLGKVCSYDSIKVTQLRNLEKYSTVYQTTAQITGRLHHKKDNLDLLRACFPGGSVTGCPKIRAMEIIEELEPARRAVYTGSLGYLSFSGNMDFNILIRTILKKKNRLYFGVGGGIVADSVPEHEYEETLVKAKAMIKAISG
ncbi:MAG: aminodeoxychorismate synthase component I [Candidatus Omnitrophica bacterium]|nr:aminodeoxychorismate synthase component I [Candidatus Omnitrophota bacterium]